MFFSLLVLLALSVTVSSNSNQASCHLRLNHDGTRIGKATFLFRTRTKEQRITVNIQGDPEKITPGWHDLRIRTKAVRGKPINCDDAGDILPYPSWSYLRSWGLLLGNIGQVEAGENGEINQYWMIDINRKDPEWSERRSEGVTHWDTLQLNDPKFYLKGGSSIVGKALVLENGDTGEPIACCNLRRER